MTDKISRRREADKTAAQRYRENNPEKVRAARQAYNARNKEKRAAAHAAWFQGVKNDPAFKEKANTTARANHRARVVKEFLETTGRVKPERCDVCKEPGRICFDHCSKALRFRGFICNRCNLVLGHAKDSPRLLRALADYLSQPPPNPESETMLTTAQIQEHFGIKLTAEFIENTLKVPPTEREKRACRWTEDAVPKIGESLAKYAVKKGSAPATPAQVDEQFAKATAHEAADDNSDLF